MTSDYNQRLKDLRLDLTERRGKQKEIKRQLEDTGEQLRSLRRNLKLSEQAQVIIQTVARMTQEEIQFQINELVTLALESVFNDPYKFEVDFVLRANRTEADLYFVRDGEKIHPLSASGGGVVDIAAVALKIACFKLSHNKTRSVLFLDEPFSHLSTDLQERAHDMLYSISKELGIQIIMITHCPEAIKYADNIIIVGIKKGKSFLS